MLSKDQIFALQNEVLPLLDLCAEYNVKYDKDNRPPTVKSSPKQWALYDQIFEGQKVIARMLSEEAYSYDEVVFTQSIFERVTKGMFTGGQAGNILHRLTDMLFFHARLRHEDGIAAANTRKRILAYEHDIILMLDPRAIHER